MFGLGVLAAAVALAGPTPAQALHSARVQAHATEASAAVVVRGRVRWAGGDGRRTTARTVFSLASLSKPYVAALTLRLADQGRLGLDDRIGDTLGEAIPPAAGEVTIRELLGHTSGLPDYLADPAISKAAEDPRHDWTEAELLRAVKPPVKRGAFAYSNTNYVLLGAILRRVANEDPAVLLDKEILAPLKLTDTSMRRVSRLARRVAGGRRLANDIWNPLFTDGAVVASAPDVGRFLDALLTTGKVLRSDTVKTMVTPGPDGEYGLGVYNDRLRGQRAIGHDGYYDGWSTAAATITQKGATVVVLMHGAPSGAAYDALARIARAARL